MFRLIDVKKTVRARGDGRRYIHPKLLDEETNAPRVALALSYFQTHLGRTRREVDPEVLVRFFGDPKVARGLVACLSASYRWHSQGFGDVVDDRTVTRLARQGLHTPGDLRLYLYDMINKDGKGFVGYDRETVLEALARPLKVTTALLDRLIALDAEENAVLLRSGPVPEPEEVIAAYNFHAVDAVLRNSSRIAIEVRAQETRDALARECAARDVHLAWDGTMAVLANTADVFGSYARGGARVTRALYACAATAPVLLASGRAVLRLGNKEVDYLLTKESLAALTGGTNAVHCPWGDVDVRASWRSLKNATGTNGWQLLTNPDPIMCQAGLIVAPFACRRGTTVALLWPVETKAGLDHALAVQRTSLLVLPIVAATIAQEVPEGIVVAMADDGARGIVGALDRLDVEDGASAGEQALAALALDALARGFVPEEEVMTVLGQSTADELPYCLRGLDVEQGVYIRGVGLCSPSFAAAMRKGLRRVKKPMPAA